MQAPGRACRNYGAKRLVHADVRVRQTRNEKGRLRIGKIDVSVKVKSQPGRAGGFRQWKGCFQSIAEWAEGTLGAGRNFCERSLRSQ